jgi:hypothetical protein
MIIARTVSSSSKTSNDADPPLVTAATARRAPAAAEQPHAIERGGGCERTILAKAAEHRLHVPSRLPQRPGAAVQLDALATAGADAPHQPHEQLAKLVVGDPERGHLGIPARISSIAAPSAVSEMSAFTR